MIDVLDKRQGFPGVFIEGNMIDPDMVSGSKIDKRLQALFETKIGGGEV